MRRLRPYLSETRHERVHLRKWRRDEHPHVFAGGPERFGESEAAPERVAIGILVAEDQDLLVGVDQLLDLVKDVGGFLRRSYDFPSVGS